MISQILAILPAIHLRIQELILQRFVRECGAKKLPAKELWRLEGQIVGLRGLFQREKNDRKCSKRVSQLCSFGFMNW
jgi:hypothetical protein